MSRTGRYYNTLVKTYVFWTRGRIFVGETYSEQVGIRLRRAAFKLSILKRFTGKITHYYCNKIPDD